MRDAEVYDVADGSRVQVHVSPEAEREQRWLVARSADARPSQRDTKTRNIKNETEERHTDMVRVFIIMYVDGPSILVRQGNRGRAGGRLPSAE